MHPVLNSPLRLATGSGLPSPGETARPVKTNFQEGEDNSPRWTAHQHSRHFSRRSINALTDELGSFSAVEATALVAKRLAARQGRNFEYRLEPEGRSRVWFLRRRSGRVPRLVFRRTVIHFQVVAPCNRYSPNIDCDAWIAQPLETAVGYAPVTVVVQSWLPSGVK
jgi:hypothetical protein